MRTPPLKKKRVAGRRPKPSGIDPDTRADILAAARSVFARVGFDGAAMREVAKIAHVNNAMIYYHFQDKEGLYRAVLSDSLGAMNRIWEDTLFQSNVPARKKIQKYIEAFIRFQVDNDDLRRILAMEFSKSGAKGTQLKWIAKNYFSKNHARLADILAQGMAAGELKKVNPIIATVSLIGMIIHAFIYMPIAPYVSKQYAAVSPSDISAAVSKLFFDGLCAKKSVKQKRPQKKDRT